MIEIPTKLDCYFKSAEWDVKCSSVSALNIYSEEEIIG